MSGLTYDTGALLAAEREDSRVWTRHRRALDRGVMPTVPAAVLAQAWRGGPQAALSRLLRGCDIDALTELEARAAGTLCALAGTADVVDASVVVSALRRGDVCVTSDPDDLARLATALGRHLELVPV